METEDAFVVRYQVCPDEPVPFLRGDCNGDAAVNLSDATCTLNWLFVGGDGPICVAAADSDDSGGVEIADAVYVLNFLFVGGPEPMAPFPECGPGADGGENLECLQGCL